MHFEDLTTFRESVAFMGCQSIAVSNSQKNAYEERELKMEGEERTREGEQERIRERANAK